MAISTLPLHDAEVLPFPRAKKRATEVRKGPKGQVLQFPLQLTGDHLRARWAWLLDNHANWRTEDPNGTYEDRGDWEASARNIGPAYAKLRCMEFGDASLRRDVREWQAAIEARNAVKAWLREQGVDLAQVRSADSALTLVYQRCLSPEPLHCA